jgi:hypothetical protein
MIFFTTGIFFTLFPYDQARIQGRATLICQKIDEIDREILKIFEIDYNFM